MNTPLTISYNGQTVTVRLNPEQAEELLAMAKDQAEQLVEQHGGRMTIHQLGPDFFKDLAASSNNMMGEACMPVSEAKDSVKTPDLTSEEIIQKKLDDMWKKIEDELKETVKKAPWGANQVAPWPFPFPVPGVKPTFGGWPYGTITGNKVPFTLTTK